jgi:transposase
MTELKGRSIGVDLHPDCFNTAEIFMKTGEIRHEKYKIRTDMDKFASGLTSDDIVVVEATTNTFAFTRRIEKLVRKVIIVHPGENQDIIRSNKKTDRIDAQKLAKLGMDIILSGRSVKLAKMPDENIVRLRSLFTTYELISKKVTMTRCRIHSLLTGELQPRVKEDIMADSKRKEIEDGEGLSYESRIQIRMLYMELDMYYSQIQELRDEIENFARFWPEEMRILISLDGFSILVALALKADYDEIGRFKNGKHLASLLRVAPTVESSNGKTIYGPVNKSSRHLALGFILQIEHHYYDRNEHLKQWRDGKIRHKSRGKIRIAIARKIIMCVYAMLTKKELYRYRNPINFARKEKQLETIIEKAA